MAVQASFTIADSSAVNRTFTRVSMDSGQAQYQDRTTNGLALSWPNVMSTIRNPVPGSPEPQFKTRVRFTMPVIATETINGVDIPKKVRQYVADVTFLMPSAGTAAEREDFHTLFQNMLSSACIEDQNINLLPLNGA